MCLMISNQPDMTWFLPVAILVAVVAFGIFVMLIVYCYQCHVLERKRIMGDTKIAVGVSVLITSLGEPRHVLLGRRINNTAAGLLSTPGGRLEENEDILSCAVRETKEETSLALRKEGLRVVDWREHFRYGQHYIMFYVHAQYPVGQSFVNKEPNKCEKWEWHPISNIVQEETTEPLEILRKL